MRGTYSKLSLDWEGFVPKPYYTLPTNGIGGRQSQQACPEEALCP